MADLMWLVIQGRPATKKTSNQVVFIGPCCRCCKRGRPVVLPSATYRTWLRAAKPQIEVQLGRPAITCPVHVTAVFYRQRLVGDLVGYQQALADALEECGVVVNDRQIVCWDGTRLAKDAKDPRVEVTVMRLA